MPLVLPEIQIERILKNGFTVLAEDADCLDDLLVNYPEDMRTEAKKYLAEHAAKLPEKVVGGWPEEGMTSPTISIVNTSDQEDTAKDVLGDFLYDLQQEVSDDKATELRGTAKRANIQMMCLSDNWRLSYYLALFVETLLILNDAVLPSLGMHEVVVGNSDGGLHEELQPEFQHARVVSLSCLHYHAVAISEPLYSKFVVNVRLDSDDTTTEV